MICHSKKTTKKLSSIKNTTCCHPWKKNKCVCATRSFKGARVQLALSYQREASTPRQPSRAASLLLHTFDGTIFSFFILNVLRGDLSLILSTFFFFQRRAINPHWMTSLVFVSCGCYYLHAGLRASRQRRHTNKKGDPVEKYNKKKRVYRTGTDVTGTDW